MPSIKTYISNIQIHHPKFLVNNEISYTIDNPSEKLSTIKSIVGVKAAASRLVSLAMASSAITGTGTRQRTFGHADGTGQSGQDQ